MTPPREHYVLGSDWKAVEDAVKKHMPGDGNLFSTVPFEGELTELQMRRLADVRRVHMSMFENSLRYVLGLRAEDV